MKFKATLAASFSSFILLGVVAGQGAEWTILFDGKSTDALRGFKRKDFPGANWVIDDGALKTVPGQDVDLVTKEKYKDFELEFEWKVRPGGNSGVMYRVSEEGQAPWHTGPECQVLDDDKHPDGKNPKTSAGSLYALVAPNSSRKLKPVGEWNQAKISLKNGHVEHWLNGAKVVEYEWGSPEIKKRIAESKFKDLPHFMKEDEGYIDFQHHGDEVWYRKIRVRKL
jgi:hypothetical protein